MRINDLLLALFLCLILAIASCQFSSTADTDTPDALVTEKEDTPLVYDPAETKTNKAIPPGTVDLLDLKGKKSRDGTQSYFNANGEPFSGTAIQLSRGKSKAYLEYTMEEGKMTRLKGYFDSGNLERDFPFKDGVSHGTLIMYHENGKKSVEEEFNMGKLSGSAKRWYENGQLWRAATFKNGKVVKEVFYHQDGSVKLK